jgi:2-oxoglutarate/2-oxoacid ferredoxin oxidoreductase subunit alpha
MATKKKENVERESVVVKFAGDSGDGMQLVGTFFADTSALTGNEVATFPYYPAEIRPPHNTVAGVSGFQVNAGAKVKTSGDLCDILVCMNPASLFANIKNVKKGATLIIDNGLFEEKILEKAGYKTNPLIDGSLSSYKLISANFSEIVKESCKDTGLDVKSVDRTRNLFGLGVVLYLCDYDLEITLKLLEKKFKSKPQILQANQLVLKTGFFFADAQEFQIDQMHIATADIDKGRYRSITGNMATAWGLLAASERSGRPLFLGSYPITPATEILMELTKQKSLGAKVFQAEDEIAGICSAIGASFAGAMACTSTSGPGLSLKAEAIGLAVITELPLVIVNVQRGGPSTGLPTKTEQSDSFYKAYEAAKLSMEHMTPTILLTDGQMGQSSELFRIPKVADLTSITPPIVEANDETYMPYKRDPETLVRSWAIPGTEGLRHRIGGLEKTDGKGIVSTDPHNHELMTKYRNDKVQKVADFIPEQDIMGEAEGDLLVVSWGGTKGSVSSAVAELQAQGKKVSHAHFSYIMPLPKNTDKLFAGFKKIIVAELNAGQFSNYLRMTHPTYQYLQYNKMQGLPFTITELVEHFNKTL